MGNPRWPAITALIALMLTAGCATEAAPTEAVRPGEVPAAEVDPGGTDQIVSYTRDRSDQLMYMFVETGSVTNGGRLGGIGCEAVLYPWTIRVGPNDRTPRANPVVLHSGSAAGGTATVWIDVTPEGEVLLGAGRPEWATAAAASGCGG